MWVTIGKRQFQWNVETKKWLRAERLDREGGMGTRRSFNFSYGEEEREQGGSWKGRVRGRGRLGTD